ncbi:hypothetical protein VTO73DRAFT_5229 [Trametes versicolor]
MALSLAQKWRGKEDGCVKQSAPHTLVPYFFHFIFHLLQIPPGNMSLLGMKVHGYRSTMADLEATPCRLALSADPAVEIWLSPPTPVPLNSHSTPYGHAAKSSSLS